MPKDVTGVPVVISTCKCEDLRDRVSNTNNNSGNKSTKNKHSTVDNNLPVDQNRTRLNKLKHAIGSGRFIINPSRVAEKLIQFEIQLST